MTDLPDRMSYDVAVIGAGPAGAIAARQLAQRGASVALIDKARFPRHKVCGGCLSAEALAILERIGLAHVPGGLGAQPLHALRISAAAHRTRIALPGGAAVSRQAFDAALVRAARDAGAAVFDGTKATLTASSSDDHVIALQRDRAHGQLRARIAIAGDGVNGHLLNEHPAFHTHVARHSRIGIGAVLDDARADYPPGVIHMATGRDGYMGVARLENNALAIAAALAPSFLRESGSAGDALRCLFAHHGWPLPHGFDDVTWKGTAMLTRRCRPVAHGRIFVLGDAAGYVEPFTGEGIAWALACGDAVVAPALRSLDGAHIDGERIWRRRYRELLRYRQWRCRAIALLLRHPALTRSALRIADRAPSLTQAFVQRIAGPSTSHHMKGQPI